MGQHFNVYPDGVILPGRSIDITPAVVKGKNPGNIGIECIGDFNEGRDIMTAAQFTGLMSLTVALAAVHKLSADDIFYHTWYDKSKSCPGTAFLGLGNTRESYNKHVRPLLDSLINEARATR